MSRIIQINPDVRLSQADGEVLIERRSVVASGKFAGEERWNFVGSYGNMELAAMALLGRHYGLIQEEHATDLKALLEEIRRAYVMVSKAVKR